MSQRQAFLPGTRRLPGPPRPEPAQLETGFAPVPRLCLAIFLALVLPLGIILATITPLGGVADETAHALRAESLSHGEILGYREPVQLPDGSWRMAAGVSADLGLEAAAMVRGPGEWVTDGALAAARAARWEHRRSYAEITPLALYMPVFYLPAALAMAGTRLLHDTPADAFMAGRMANLLVFAGLGLLALRRARAGHALLLCTLALPMEVSLAASLNQDGLLIAAAVLAVAYLTRAAEEAALMPAGRERPTAAWAMAGLLLGLVALAKPPYGGLMLMLLFPLRPGRSCALRLAGAAAFALPALCWMIYALHAIATPWPPMAPYAAGPLWPGSTGRLFTSPDATAQLRVLAAAPWRIVTLTLHSLWHDRAMAFEVIGVLGFLSLPLPLPLYALWCIALMAAMLADRQERGALPVTPGEQMAILLMLLLITIAIYMSQYLSWTPVGAAAVIGPSGRYFLPLLPAAVFLLPRLRLFQAAPPGLLLLPLAAAAIASLIIVPLAVLDGFYAP